MPEMFRTRFQTFVQSAGQNAVMLERWLELPFVPFVGLEVWFPEDCDSGHEIKGVHWVVDERIFACDIDSDVDTEPLEEMLKVWEGWTIVTH